MDEYVPIIKAISICILSKYAYAQCAYFNGFNHKSNLNFDRNVTIVGAKTKLSYTGKEIFYRCSR